MTKGRDRVGDRVSDKVIGNVISASRTIPRAAARNARKKATPGAPATPPARVVKKAAKAAAKRVPRETPVLTLDVAVFRRKLNTWYRLNARVLPWRGIVDPYHTWVSEIMLQQTRVAAVIDHYTRFLKRFPTLVALALAPEPEVLAAWSGLGYYRRARMLHKAAQFIVLELHGKLPATSTALRSLPGIGEYTSAAIASIAFGESIAVVDGNVERVLLRVTGRPDEASAAGRAFIHAQAQALVPGRRITKPTDKSGAPRLQPANWQEASELKTPEHPGESSPESDGIETWVSSTNPDGQTDRTPRLNAAGDHNQAMMELGATLCLPRGPLCLQCPVYDLCLTRGEHRTPPRAATRSRPAAYLLNLRKRGPITEVLLELRPAEASLMPSMFELPALPLDSIEGREPILRVRHAITNTNYYVEVFSPTSTEPDAPLAFPRTRTTRAGTSKSSRKIDSNPFTASALPDPADLLNEIPAAVGNLHWTRTSRLATMPLTGLARKVLQRLHVMDDPRPRIAGTSSS